MTRPGRAEPLLIWAVHLAAARARAIDLGLPASTRSPFWRYLSEVHQLRGRSRVRIVTGWDPYGSRAGLELGDVLQWMRTTRPGSVVYVEDRAGVLELFPELARPGETYRPVLDDGPPAMTEADR